jgi:hypothetical protein
VSETLARVKELVGRGDVRISAHGYDELAEDDIFAGDIIAGTAASVELEDYPDAAYGPSVLVLQRDFQGRPVHAVWGIPKDRKSPAVLITAYRPDPVRWNAEFTQRKKS